MTILFIGKETPLRKLIELCFIEVSYEYYSYSCLEDCKLMIKDLSPDLLILDLDDFSCKWQSLNNYLIDQTSDIPVVGLGSAEIQAPENYSNFHYVKTILRPINPGRFLEEIDEVINSHKGKDNFG